MIDGIVDGPIAPALLIPGGAHTYSKGDDQFPANAPRFLERGAGATVWDENGIPFLDWGMGLRTVSLGYGRKSVIDAAVDQMWAGSNFTRPSRIESETAQDLIDLIPSAQMVKFAKNGSSVTTAAVKLARAVTGRPLIAVCSDHPFYSYDDWFIATTPCNGGVPEAFGALTRSFRYNDWQSVEQLFDRDGSSIAGIIMEAATSEAPRADFLTRLRAKCRANGTLFILDEMITGFRWHINGAQTYFALDPDLSTFGKGIANGFSVAALVGRRDIMNAGGSQHSGKRVFLMSSTHGAENHALAACRAALRVFREEPVIEHFWTIGSALIEGMNAVIAQRGLSAFVEATGYPCSPSIICRDAAGRVSLPFRSLFLQETVRRGIIMNYLAPSFSHTIGDVERTIDALTDTLGIYAQALEAGYERYLIGPPIKPVFRPFN